MVAITDIDAHEQPPDELRAEWKSWAKMEPRAVLDDPRIDDPRKPPRESGFLQTGRITQAQRRDAFSQLGQQYAAEATEDAAVLHHPLLPGLLVIPSLVPPAVQIAVLDTVLHRDLSDPRHQTNLHLHYRLPYPDGDDLASRSLFSLAPESPTRFTPRDPAVHKPLSARQVFGRRLHWVTLGGQYDWTNRIYPQTNPEESKENGEKEAKEGSQHEEQQQQQKTTPSLPAFPSDIARFLAALFPDTDAQAAIVNLYSVGDTMMMHRDVSEFTDRGLVSLSFGCDGLFMIAPDDKDGDKDNGSHSQMQPGKKNYLLLRLRSGDAIYMTRESRVAWHGVPRILPDTCPDYLRHWPAREDGTFADWDGWIKGKRINLNVRQVYERE